MTDKTKLEDSLCEKAIRRWESLNKQAAVDAEDVNLTFPQPNLIRVMDRALLNLTSCRRLSLSGNCIEHMIPLQGLASLKVLVLTRNDIRRI